MADPKVIAVAGATGAQGGGLIRAILADKGGGFSARALTRDAQSEKAKALAEAGAEVVETNVDDVDSVRRAFSGAYGAFCVTFFWDHFSPERELAQATALAHAAKDARIQHAIWSTLEDVRRFVPLTDDRMPTLMGKYKVPHLDAKGEADHIFTDLGVPTTFLLTTFYWENFIYFGQNPKPTPDGKLAITMPMGTAKLAGIAAEDIGKSAYGIFKRGPEFIGKTIGIAGEHLTLAQIALAMTKALGREVRYNEVSPETYRSFGFPAADDIGNMFQFFRDFEQVWLDARPVDATRALNPQLQTFERWLAGNRNRIPLE